MKELNILLSTIIISLLCSCSLWDKRKQLINLALHGSKPNETTVAPIMLSTLSTTPIVPEEKTLVDVLKAFSEWHR